MNSKRKLFKRVILIIIVALLILGAIIYIFIINNKNNSKDQSSKTQLNSDLKTESIIEDEEEIDNEKTEGVSEKETNDNVQNEVTPSTKQVIEQTPQTNNNVTNNNSNNGNNYVAPYTPPVEKTPEPTLPACTPKKFYTTFRADFTSEAECESTYNYYHNIDPNKYLGFICSYQTDDCGVMYYMLTFFDSSGNYFGYNEI